jgi:hypothetical protein
MFRSLPVKLLAVTLLLTGGCSGPDQADSELDAFQMQVGDCFDDDLLSGSEVSGLPGIPCEQPHDNQVYALFDLSAPEFPGDDAVLALANEGCLERFPDAIGTSYEASVYAFTTLTPTERSWTELADREVVCIAYHMEMEKLTTTVLGSGR